MTAGRPLRQRLSSLALGLMLCSALLSACASHRLSRPMSGTTQRGIASWYGEPFHGRKTASGETYDMHGLSAAHRELPLGTRIEVHNLENGRRVELRVNDRGPFVRGRILDLSYGAAKALDVVRAGLAKVEIRVLDLGSGRAGPGPNSRFTVQLGAFSQRQNAVELMQRVAARHPDAEVVSQGDLHRVRLGLFRSQTEAEELRRQLMEEGLDALVIVLPPPWLESR